MTKALIQTLAIAIPIGTAIGKRPYYIDLDAEYKNCRGLYVIRNVGTDYAKIEVKDSTGKSIVSPVNVTHLTVANSVPIANRFFTETPFEAKGKKSVVTIELFAVPAVEQNFDIVFLLDNKE